MREPFALPRTSRGFAQRKVTPACGWKPPDCDYCRVMRWRHGCPRWCAFVVQAG
ncbi:unnamed protein product [Ectocarpus sp. CCAP 1310/34]|nr:unnamed protein product [Ectocarpus sp. CCAP 1310/34]